VEQAEGQLPLRLRLAAAAALLGGGGGGGAADELEVLDDGHCERPQIITFRPDVDRWLVVDLARVASGAREQWPRP